MWKWLDPMPTGCPSCGGRSPIPVAALRSLLATCPGCGTSLASAGEWLLAEEERRGRLISLWLVGCELQHRGVAMTDGDVDAAHTLGDLTRCVADRLGGGAGCQARAAELVAEAARRVSPALLREVGPSA